MTRRRRTPPAGNGHVGRALKRKEDPRLITGRAHLRRRHRRHRAAVGGVRALARGAREDRLDRHVGAPRRCPGVHAVFTGDDLDLAAPLPMAWVPPGIEVNTPEHWPLAKDEVKHVGDPVARRDRRGPLRRRRRRRAGRSSSTTRCRSSSTPRRRSRTARRSSTSSSAPTRCHEWSLGGGDVDAGFAEADVIVERRDRQPPHGGRARSSRAACSPTTAPAR